MDFFLGRTYRPWWNGANKSSSDFFFSFLFFSLFWPWRVARSCSTHEWNRFIATHIPQKEKALSWFVRTPLFFSLRLSTRLNGFGMLIPNILSVQHTKQDKKYFLSYNFIQLNELWTWSRRESAPKLHFYAPIFWYICPNKSLSTETASRNMAGRLLRSLLKNSARASIILQSTKTVRFCLWNKKNLCSR